MRYIFAILFYTVLLSSDINAQNFQTITSGSEKFYLKDLIHGIRIDSVHENNGDSTLFNYRYFYDRLCINDQLYKKEDGTPWIGDSIIIKANGDNIFYNDSAHPILIKTQVHIGSQWIVYTYSNGNKIYGTIQQIYTDTVLGSVDTIKKILLTVKDQANIPLTSHPWYGKNILLSKNYGLIKTFSKKHFPHDHNFLELIKGKRLTKRDIYDFNVGDVFQGHFSQNWFGSSSNGYGPVVVYTKRIDSPGNDTIYYETNRDTFEVTDLDSIYMHKMPFETYDVDFYDLTWYEMYFYCGQRIGYTYKTGRIWNYYSPTDSCYNYLGEPNPYDFSYGKGLGQIMFYKAHLYNYIEQELTYYNKSTDSCGTLKATGVKELTDDTKINIFPNPVDDVIYVKFSHPTLSKGSILIYDLQGREIIQEDLINNNAIDLSNLSGGVYILVVQTDKEKYSRKVIKK